jgi:hypothetical protein
MLKIDGPGSGAGAATKIFDKLEPGPVLEPNKNQKVLRHLVKWLLLHPNPTKTNFPPTLLGLV